MDISKRLCRQEKNFEVKPLIWVGTQDFNYKYNLKYMDYLTKLEIPYEKLILPDVPHSAKTFYQKKGLEIMYFHDRNFGN